MLNTYQPYDYGRSPTTSKEDRMRDMLIQNKGLQDLVTQQTIEIDKRDEKILQLQEKLLLSSQKVESRRHDSIPLLSKSQESTKPPDSEQEILLLKNQVENLKSENDRLLNKRGESSNKPLRHIQSEEFQRSESRSPIKLNNDSAKLNKELISINQKQQDKIIILEQTIRKLKEDLRHSKSPRHSYTSNSSQLNSSVSDSRDLQIQNGMMKEKILKLETQIENLQKKISEGTKEITEAFKTNQLLLDQKCEVQSTNLFLKKDVFLLQGEIKQYQEQIKQLTIQNNQQNQVLETTVKEQQTLISKLQEQVKKQQQEFESKQESLNQSHKLQIKNIQNQYNLATTQLDQKTTNLINLENKLHQTKRDHHEIMKLKDEQIINLTNELDSYNGRPPTDIQYLEEEIKSLRRQCEAELKINKELSLQLEQSEKNKITVQQETKVYSNKSCQSPCDEFVKIPEKSGFSQTLIQSFGVIPVEPNSTTKELQTPISTKNKHLPQLSIADLPAIVDTQQQTAEQIDQLKMDILRKEYQIQDGLDRELQLEEQIQELQSQSRLIKNSKDELEGKVDDFQIQLNKLIDQNQILLQQIDKKDQTIKDQQKELQQAEKEMREQESVLKQDLLQFKNETKILQKQIIELNRQIQQYNTSSIQNLSQSSSFVEIQQQQQQSNNDANLEVTKLKLLLEEQQVKITQLTEECSTLKESLRRAQQKSNDLEMKLNSQKIQHEYNIKKQQVEGEIQYHLSPSPSDKEAARRSTNYRPRDSQSKESQTDQTDTQSYQSDLIEYLKKQLQMALEGMNDMRQQYEQEKELSLETPSFEVLNLKSKLSDAERLLEQREDEIGILVDEIRGLKREQLNKAFQDSQTRLKLEDLENQVVLLLLENGRLRQSTQRYGSEAFSDQTTQSTNKLRRSYQNT